MVLSYGLSLNTSLVYAIENQSILANYLVSVERINQYTHIPSEAQEIIEGNHPPHNWPVAGKVEIKDLKVIGTYLENVKHSAQKKYDMKSTA